MKSGTRIALCAASVIVLSLYLLEAHIQDICNQYRAGAYLVEWWYHKSESIVPAHHATPNDKVIVMAKLEEEDTDWVGEELPEYVPIAQIP